MNLLYPQQGIDWGKKLSNFSTLVFKLALLALFLILVFVIVRGLKQEGYRLQTFQVPKELNDAGYNGQVVALMLQDQITVLEELANSSRDDSLSLNVDLKPDLNLEVMGVGLSATSMIYHLRELIGRRTNTISGNVTDLEDVLTLEVRMTGYPNFEVEIPHQPEQIREALENAIDKGALHILGNTDPYRLSIVHHRRGDTDKAENIIRNIIKNRPSDRKWAYHFWGNIKGSQREHDKAIKYYRKALEEDPSFTLPMQALAWRLFRGKKYDEALSLFDRILENDPMHPSAHNGLALCHREFGELDKAESHYQQQMKKHPTLIWAYDNYSNFLMRYKNDPQGSAEVWKTASENMDESAEYYVALAAHKAMLGDTITAMSYGFQALDLDPDNVSVLMQFANYYYYSLKDFANAATYFKRYAIATEKQNYERGMQVSGWNMLAMSEYKQGKYDSSFVHVQRAISLIPDNPYPWSTLAELNVLRKDISGFYEAIEKAVQLGFELGQFLDEHPYNLVTNQSRLLQIIKKYKKEEGLKG